MKDPWGGSPPEPQHLPPRLLLPAAPAAALTTAVTAPVSGTRLVVDAAAPPTVHVEGTASAGASVDIVCVSQQTGEPDLTVVPIAAGVPVDKHAFATDVTWPSDPGLCEVYAVAPGTVPTAANDLNGLQGSLVYEAATDTSSADGKVYDYATFMDGADGAYAVGSFGACPVTLGELVHQHDEQASIFDCNGYLEATDPTSATDAPQSHGGRRARLHDLHDRRRRSAQCAAGLDRADVQRSAMTRGPST